MHMLFTSSSLTTKHRAKLCFSAIWHNWFLMAQCAMIPKPHQCQENCWFFLNCCRKKGTSWISKVNFTWEMNLSWWCFRMHNKWAMLGRPLHRIILKPNNLRICLCRPKWKVFLLTLFQFSIIMPWVGSKCARTGFELIDSLTFKQPKVLLQFNCHEHCTIETNKKKADMHERKWKARINSKSWEAFARMRCLKRHQKVDAWAEIFKRNCQWHNLWNDCQWQLRCVLSEHHRVLNFFELFHRSQMLSHWRSWVNHHALSRALCMQSSDWHSLLQNDLCFPWSRWVVSATPNSANEWQPDWTIFEIENCKETLMHCHLPFSRILPSCFFKHCCSMTRTWNLSWWCICTAWSRNLQLRTSELRKPQPDKLRTIFVWWHSCWWPVVLLFLQKTVLLILTFKEQQHAEFPIKLHAMTWPNWLMPASGCNANMNWNGCGQNHNVTQFWFNCNIMVLSQTLSSHWTFLPFGDAQTFAACHILLKCQAESHGDPVSGQPLELPAQ